MADDGLLLRMLTGRGVPADARALGVLGGVLPGTPFIRRGQATTVGDVLAGAAQTGHRTIGDQDYQCVSTDLQVGMKPLTAPRTIWLPDVDTFPFQDLVLADESGACSEALTITILPGPGTNDVIGTSDGNVILSRPYEGVWLRRGGANLWIRR